MQYDGLTISRKTVQRHMQEMGIAGISPGPNLSRRRKEHVVLSVPAAGVTSSRPNQVWGSTSPTSAYRNSGCIWWPSWIGTRAM